MSNSFVPWSHFCNRDKEVNDNGLFNNCLIGCNEGFGHNKILAKSILFITNENVKILLAILASVMEVNVFDLQAT